MGEEGRVRRGKTINRGDESKGDDRGVKKNQEDPVGKKREGEGSGENGK